MRVIFFCINYFEVLSYTSHISSISNSTHGEEGPVCKNVAKTLTVCELLPCTATCGHQILRGQEMEMALKQHVLARNRK